MFETADIVEIYNMLFKQFGFGYGTLFQVD
jgi:hypothetical protein